MKGLFVYLLVLAGCFSEVITQGSHHQQNIPSRGKQVQTDTRGSSKHRVVCPGAWEVGSYKCYKVIFLETDWISALMHCIVMRAHLIDIDSLEEQKEVANILKKYQPYLSRKRLWIDGSDQNTEGQWQWMNFGQNITYSNWYQNQPPPKNLRLNCGLMLGNSYMWGASDCNAKYPFICEANPLR